MKFINIEILKIMFFTIFQILRVIEVGETNSVYPLPSISIPHPFQNIFVKNIPNRFLLVL